MAKNLAPNRGFQGPAIQFFRWNFKKTDSCCHGNDNFEILTKLATNQIIQELLPNVVNQKWVLVVVLFNTLIKIYKDRPLLS